MATEQNGIYCHIQTVAYYPIDGILPPVGIIDRQVQQKD